MWLCCAFLLGLVIGPFVLAKSVPLCAALIEARFYLSATRQYLADKPDRPRLRRRLRLAWGYFWTAYWNGTGVGLASVTMRDGSRYEKGFLGYARRVV